MSSATKATPAKPTGTPQERAASLPSSLTKTDEKDKPTFFARTLDKARARIEQGVGRLKRFKRVALRCEKTERNFRSIVSFAAGSCLTKFVHTAYASAGSPPPF
jgi:transposase